MPADTGPRYRLHQTLGEGGMGVVHVGTQVSAAGERLVAIKRLASRAEVDAAARARLVAEAKLVFQLTYANICQVLDLGENESGTFVVMEYVRGDDLAGLLARVEAGGGRLDVAASVYIAREVARALDYAHRRVDAKGRSLGLVHGDVKPPNILLSVEGEVKLADFGIARALGGSAPGTGILGGTPGFMAPEAHSGTLDHRADVYSLGATLARALLGHSGGDAPPGADAWAARATEIPRELREIVARALAPTPGARWLSAADLERALAAWLARRHPEFTPSVLADIVRRHARPEHVARPALDTPEGVTEVLDMHTLLDEEGAGAADAADDDGPAPRVAERPERPRTETAARPEPRRWSRLAWIGAFAALAAVGAIAGARAVASRTDPSPAAPSASAAVVLVSSGAADAAPIALPPSPDAGATAAAPTPAPPTRARRPAAAPPRADRAARADEPARAPEPAEWGYLTVNATPWGSVFVDGRRVAEETPAYRLRLPAGRHLVHVEFGDGGGRSAPLSVSIEAGEQRTVGFRR